MKLLECRVIRLPSSIKSKVRFGFYLCLGLVIAVTFLNYLNLRALDRKITLSFIISELFDTTLEMRRFEKNYFLYKDVKEYQENMAYTDKAEMILRKSVDSVRRLSPNINVESLLAVIAGYRSSMKEYFVLDKSKDPVAAYVLEGRIRENGRRLVEATEAISVAERAYIQSLIARSERIKMGSIVFLIIMSFAVGNIISRVIVQPLKQLEDSMQRIADGQFDSICVQSKDTEIMSLGSACSRMISELELRQKKFIMQSEKLAALGTMVSGVAHELNNPLSNISSSCQILHEEIADADLEYKKVLLQQIEEEIDRAKTMVRSLLEFSRKTEFRRKPYSLKYLVEDTVRLLHGDIPTKVEINVAVADEIWVHVDKQRIQQALLNFIKNAIEAIPDDGAVTVEASRIYDENEIEIAIRDNGVGIEPEKLEKIFEPFFTTKGDEKGSGLGLFVTKEIIEEHGGTVHVRSRSGEGTTFYVRLPHKEA